MIWIKTDGAGMDDVECRDWTASIPPSSNPGVSSQDTVAASPDLPMV